MSDAKVVNAGENTPEHIAYKLLTDVMNVEDMSYWGANGKKRVDRKYLLDTYSECLDAVKGRRTYG